MDRLMVGVSGVRGTIGGTLTEKVARDFGSAFGTMLGEGKTVTMARDTRPSGPMIRDEVTAGLIAAGVSVIDLGVVSTPGAAFMTRRLAADGGVIITASHNPAQYNGIKFLQPTGLGLSVEEAARLKEIWQSGKFRKAARPGNMSQNNETHGAHIEAVCKIIDPPAIASKKFKVVLDSINGAGCVGTPMLLGRLGCQVIHINGEPSGEFAHTPEPIEQNLQQLCRTVAESGAAIGFAQDPDADRLVVVDENGTFIGEEYTLALTTAYMLSRYKGKVATNLATSRMIDDIAAKAGCEVIRTPTGEANVAGAMEANKCVFGGEGNGGVIDPRVVPVRDSFVGIALMLQYLADTGKTVSRLVAQIPAYVLVKTKMPCPADAAGKVAERTRKLFAARKGVRFNDADGLRIDLPEGWLCVRASNTEPIMRIFAEARDEKTAQGLVDMVRKIADEIIGK